MLDESRRSQLNGLIEKMKANQEDDSAIRDMVGQFKAKYDAPQDPEAVVTAAPQPDVSPAEASAADEKSSIFPAAIQEYQNRFYKPAGSIGQSLRDFGAVGLAGVGDVFGTLQRGAAAAFTDQKMSDPGAHALKTQTDRNVQDYGRQMDAYRGDPRAFGAPAPTPVGKIITETTGRLIDDPLSYAGILAKTLSYIPSMTKGLGRGVGTLNRGVGRLAQEMSGVPEEALRAYGDPTQKARILANAGKESEIGSELLSQIDRPDKFLPEKQVVDAALAKMGDIPLQPTIDALEGAKGASIAGRLSPEKVAANATIDKYIDFLRGGATPDDLAPSLPAAEFRKLRQDLDVPVKWDQEGGAIANSALKTGRTSMKDALLQKAAESGNPEYAAAMSSWSEKLDKLDRIKKVLGKTGEARDKRVEGFIDNLFGKQNKYKRELMADLDDIFKSDIVDRAKAAQDAQALGPEGVPTWLPRQMNGRSTLGLVGSIAAGTATGQAPLALGATALVASPKIAANFTLPALTKLEKGLKASGIAMTPRAASTLAALKKPINEAQRVRLATILAAELEAQLPANVIPFRMKDAAGLDEEPQYTQR